MPSHPLLLIAREGGRGDEYMQIRRIFTVIIIQSRYSIKTIGP